MVDVVDKMTRSRMMAGIRGKNTHPERLIRSALHIRGFRYRLHGKTLSGKPDIVLRKYGAVIFVNGCFWHGHECKNFKWPKTHLLFWREKILSNARRDKNSRYRLQNDGWKVITVWECAIRNAVRREKMDVLIDGLVRKIKGRK